VPMLHTVRELPVAARLQEPAIVPPIVLA
jgi:hypothetical protein